MRKETSIRGHGYNEQAKNLSEKTKACVLMIQTFDFLFGKLDRSHSFIIKMHAFEEVSIITAQLRQTLWFQNNSNK